MATDRLLSSCIVSTILLMIVIHPPRITDARPLAVLGAVESACGGVITGTVSTSLATTCDEIGVTTSFQPFCPVCPGGVHVVYIQPDPAPDRDWVISTATRSVDALEQQQPFVDMRVGVVHYGSNRVLVAQEMTDDLSKVRVALRQLGAGVDGFASFDGAARTALRLLERAKNDQRTTQDPCEFVIFFASNKLYPATGEPANGDLLRRAGQLLRAGGRPVIMGCAPMVAGWADCSIAKDIASPPRNYVEAPDSSKLATLVERVLEELQHSSQLSIVHLELTEHLPVGIRYVADSANPPAASVGNDAGVTVLRWDWARDQIKLLKPYTVTYRIQPALSGTWAISGELGFTDSGSAQRLIPAPTRVITVTDELCNPIPTPTPTDMPTAPPPTDTPTPTDTPIPPTATSMPTATPSPGPIYLPIAVKDQECRPGQQHIDVVLVIDASSSMLVPTRAGRTKLAAAVEAARTFIGQLNPDTDQAAIVAFNAQATMLQSLTGDRAALEVALAGIQPAQLTRIDLGLKVALEEITGARHRATNSRAVILLTDGRNNPEPVSSAIAQAEAIKGAGVRLFTIGLGEQIDAVALAEMASRPEDYYRAPDGEDLAAIYNQIAYAIPCPDELHWPNRLLSTRTGLSGW